MINGRSMLRLITFAALLVAAALLYAQSEVSIHCQDGWCIMKEADVDRIQAVINALVERIEELKGKSGCT